jgi:hypothetical protein
MLSAGARAAGAKSFGMPGAKVASRFGEVLSKCILHFCSGGESGAGPDSSHANNEVRRRPRRCFDELQEPVYLIRGFLGLQRSGVALARAADLRPPRSERRRQVLGQSVRAAPEGRPRPSCVARDASWPCARQSVPTSMAGRCVAAAASRHLITHDSQPGLHAAHSTFLPFALRSRDRAKRRRSGVAAERGRRPRPGPSRRRFAPPQDRLSKGPRRWFETARLDPSVRAARGLRISLGPPHHERYGGFQARSSYQ